MTTVTTTKPVAKTPAKKPAAPKGAAKAKADPKAAKPAASAAPEEPVQQAWNFPTAKEMDDKRAALHPDIAAPKGKTVRKGAGKTAEGKPAAKTSGEKKAKDTAAAVAFIARKAEPGAVLTLISTANSERPTGGVKLFAHTHAALTVLGMMDAACPEVPMKALFTVLGATAVKYHLKQRNFVQAKDDRVALSTAGYNRFKNRSVDNALANAYVDMFLDGKLSPALGLREGQVYKTTVGI